ncbi:MAG: hypothetical protein EOP92_09830 [Lysobacteraceae bacterium]|nr:MAG: hypothetical protein EOP92_09830 [Xanthomonadaceae bacterium]
MRTKLLLAAAATFVTLSASASPQGVGTERVTVVGAQPQQTRMAAFAFDGVQGDYALEDGRTLTVTGKVDGRTHARTLYADLGDGPTEIVHVGKNRFVAAGQDLRLSFDRQEGRKPSKNVHITSQAGHSVALAQR